MEILVLAALIIVNGHYHTLSGMTLLLIGRIPHETDTAEWDGWRFESVDMDGKRIDKVLAIRVSR